MGNHVRAGDVDIWTDQVGEGPDVLLAGGARDTVESWQFQLDGLAERYRLTASDNRGAGRTAMPSGPVSAEMVADDAAAVLRALDLPSAHVAGFSGGSIIPGARAPSSRVRAQPRPAEHLVRAGPLPSLVAPVRPLARRGRSRRRDRPVQPGTTGRARSLSR
jgi:hypothetical protein